MITIAPQPQLPVITQQNLKTTNAANTTANIGLWRLTGHIYVLALYGIIETAIGPNHTNGHFRLNDQTAQYNITLQPAGLTLSACVVGRMFGKTDLVTVAATLVGGLTNVGAVVEPATKQVDSYFSPFVIEKKTAANTDIEYRYTTTDNPTTGAIRFYIAYQPLSKDGALVAL